MTTITVTPADVSAATPAYVGLKSTPTGPVVEATNATVQEPWNVLVEGASLNVTPPYHRDLKLVQAVNGSQIEVSDLSDFENYADGFLQGGSVTAYRIASDVFSEVGTSEITVSAARTVTQVRELLNGSYLPSSASSMSFSWRSFRREDVTEYIAVCAIGADGRRSPWSNIVAVTVASDVSGISATGPTTEDAITYDLTDEDGALAAPTNLQASTTDGGRTYDVTWTQSAGASGYVVARSSYSQFDVATYLETQDDLSLQVGDMLVLSRRIDETVSDDGFIGNYLWQASRRSSYGLNQRDVTMAGTQDNLSWEFLVEDGIPYVRLTATDTVTMRRVVHAGSERSPFYSVLEAGVSYGHLIEARSSTPGAISIATGGVDSGGTFTPTLATDFQEHTGTFSRTTEATGTSLSFATLTINGPCVVDIRAWWTGDARDTIGTGLTARNAVVLGQADLLRGHHTIKTRPASYDVWGLISDPKKLLRILTAAKDAGQSRVWVQVEYHLSAAEIAVLMEYMCTPYNPATDTPEAKPAAYRRYQQGQAQPWQDYFDKVIFEPGNENWNILEEFYTMPSVSGEGSAKAIALLGNWIKSQMLSHPDFVSSKWIWYAGGRASSASWNADIIQWTDTALETWFGIANYNGGWDNGQPAPDPANVDDLKRIIYNPQRTSVFDDAEALFALAEPKGFDVTTYEGGQGYSLDGLNGQTVTDEDAQIQHEVMKSVGTATATFAAWLDNAAGGMSAQNYFLAGDDAAGIYWSSHTPPYQGGATNASYKWVVEFWNTHFVGCRVGRLPNFVTPISTDIPDLVEAEDVQGWTVDGGGKRFVVLANFNVSTTHDVTYMGAVSASVTRHFLTRSDLLTANITPATKDDVALSSEVLPVTDRLSRSLAPASIEVFEV